MEDSQTKAEQVHEIHRHYENYRKAGVSLPLISLLNKHSFESGDIYSLEILGEWAKLAGISLIQLLPLNDLGFGRSPYSSISAFAIDPVYISLYLLGINKTTRSNSIKSNQAHIQRIKELKIEMLREHFTKIRTQELESEINEFIKANPWLTPYTSFIILYRQNNGQHWNLWRKYKIYSRHLTTEIFGTHQEEFLFHAWMQKVANQQLRNAKKTLSEKEISLIGDMPILTSENSADVWSRDDLFNLTLTSGAPPDQFTSDGQNWGFPVFNWPRMKETGYSWWKERVSYLENFFDYYRIDHVIGMYRIWAIPKDQSSAKFGYFHPQAGTSREDFIEAGLNPDDFKEGKIIYEFEPGQYIFHWDFYHDPVYAALDEKEKYILYKLSEKYLSEDELNWKQNGEQILNFLMEQTKMIPCAEDLGAVPGFIRDSIFENKIIGLDIIRWTRSFTDGSYISPDHYRKVAISSLSVHDTSIAYGWWLELSKEDRHAFSKIANINEDDNPIAIMEKLLTFSLSTRSIFSINLLHDFLIGGQISIDPKSRKYRFIKPDLHRINIPGTPEDENWGYRFTFFAEDLLHDTELSSKIRFLITNADRLG